MKKIIAAVLFLAAVSFFGTAQASNFPASGKYTVPGGFNGTFKVVKVDKTDQTVTVELPTIAQQLEKEGITNPSWEANTSYCWHNGTSWILVAEGSYALPTTVTKDGNLLVTTKPLKQGHLGWYRFWGQDTKSGKWLWIDQGDSHNRNDAQGNPGYEVMVDYKTGLAEVVPNKYDTRK